MKRLFIVVMVVGALMFGSMNVLTQGAMANSDDKKKMEKDDSKKKADKDAAKADKEASKKAEKDDSMKEEKDDSKKKSSKKKTLYSRLGGKKAITAVVDEFVNIVAADTRINSFFAKTAGDEKQLAKFKGNLIDQICEASGGPCKYKGLDMKTAHKGMGVSDADFGALVEDLVKALDKFKVGETEKNELLGALGPMKGDIVEK